MTTETDNINQPLESLEKNSNFLFLGWDRIIDKKNFLTIHADFKTPSKYFV